MTLVIAAAAAAGTGWIGMAPAAAEQPCDEFGGTVDAEQLCQVNTSTADYTIKLTIPMADRNNAAAIDYVRQNRDGFISVASMPGALGLPYELDMTSTLFDAATPGGRTHSLVFETYQNVGGAHPATWYKAFTIPVASNVSVAPAPLTFEQLFAPGSQPLNVIFPAVQADLTRQLGVAAPVQRDDGMNPANYQNFALTDADVIFFFGQGELMPQAAGANQVRIPRSTLPPLAV